MSKQEIYADEVNLVEIFTKPQDSPVHSECIKPNVLKAYFKLLNSSSFYVAFDIV